MTIVPCCLLLFSVTGSLCIVIYTMYVSVFFIVNNIEYHCKWRSEFSTVQPGTRSRLMQGSASWMQGRARWMPGSALHAGPRALMQASAHWCRAADAGSRALDAGPSLQRLLGYIDACWTAIVEDNGHRSTLAYGGTTAATTLSVLLRQWFVWNSSSACHAKGWESTKHCRQYCTTLKTL